MFRWVCKKFGIIAHQLATGKEVFNDKVVLNHGLEAHAKQQ